MKAKLPFTINSRRGSTGFWRTRVHLILWCVGAAVSALLTSTNDVAFAEDVTVSLPSSAALKLMRQLNGDGPGKIAENLRDIADVTFAVQVPMRDGINLAATVIIPRSQHAKEPLPVILIRTPFDLSLEFGEPLTSKLVPEFIRNGYAIVVVNDRGTQWSEGSYHWLKGANRDGYDILEWITKQRWSNGNVGTYGCSSSAESELPMATMNHPAHKAMVAMAAATGVSSIPGYSDQGVFYHGGVPDLSWTFFYTGVFPLNHPQLPVNLSAEERAQVARTYSPQPIFSLRFLDFENLGMLLPASMDHLPSEDILRALDSGNSEWDRLIRLSPVSAEWAEFDFVRAKDRTSVPGLHIGSWYDGAEAYPTVKMFEHLSRVSSHQHLIMGGTAHCQMGSETEHTKVGDREVGDARFDYVSAVMGFFNEWLKGIASNSPLPTVQYYVLNSNRWERAPSWPPPGTTPLTLFLDSKGHANSLFGDGTLLPRLARNLQGVDSYSYDPLHPVPSPIHGGSWSSEAALEQSSIEARQDILVYTTDAFPQSVRVVGDVNVNLSVSTSVPDTDLMAKLVDVYPDGRAYNLTDTALRLRYRNGSDRLNLMQAGHIYEVVLHGMVTATDLLPGHKLRIEITSSNFPNLERNLNTGGRNFDESLSRVARVWIHHDLRHTSSLELRTFPK